MFLVGFPQDGALVLCRDSTPNMDIILFYRLLDLVDCFDLLCGMGGHDVSSLCVPQDCLQGTCYNRVCLIWGYWM